MHYKILIFTVLFLILPFRAQALAFSEETNYGSDEFYQNVYADGDFGAAKADQDPPFSWMLNYNYERTSTPNSGAASIIDNTYSYTAGLGWSGESEFSVFAKLNYASTPDENLKVRGAQLSVAYRYVYAQPDDSGFASYLNFKLLGSTTNYVETYTGSVARKKKAPRPVSGSTELHQNMLGFDVGWKPVRHWKFDFEVDSFTYNRDVGDFENQLDSSAALQRGMSGFADTAGGVASVTYSGTANWQFADDWHLILLEQYSRLAADQSVSTTSKATVTDQLSEAWKLTLGVEYLNSNVFSDTLAILGVEFEI